MLQPTLLAGLSGIAPAALPRASSLVNASRSIFQSLGVAMLATILATVTADQLSTFRAPPPAAFPPPGLPQTVAHAASVAFSHAFLAGLSRAYFLTFIVASAAFVVALLLPGWPFRDKPPADDIARADRAAAEVPGLAVTSDQVSATVPIETE